ncbi:LOW QUALITY PROTEIN: GTPase Era, mitochondrial [Rhopalosiphum padi]|uniref:LOW QUALITY PROTEIN: GTPase Era, mitochondrial n=1 Tax=Rhopalosiphum padi TaxID=40932 RepID=UPI00298D6F2B|nr:LOW QUALITY PROTEIN: GTPase Era, mitochondrial [Rhopalosiphum padi]
MAKYLSTIFLSIGLKPVVIPSRVHSLLKCNYSLNSEQFHINSDNQNENESIKINRQRLLKIAIIGVPNAGKSSIINSIVQRNICPYSCKVHTTRSSVRAVRTVDDTQLVFLDTPGLVDSTEITKYNLEKTFAKDSVNSIEEADIIGVIHDVSNRYTRNRLDPKVLRLLHLYPNKDSFLVLNKIDLLKSKSYLLDLARSLTCYKHNNIHVPEPYAMTSEKIRTHESSTIQERKLEKNVKQSTGWANFKDVFMVSAIHSLGSSDIEDYLLQKGKPSPWMFSKDILTDKEDHKLVLHMIESILYDSLPNEVPYNLKVEMEYYEVSQEGNIHIVVLIHCNTPRIEKLVMGKKGNRIRNIAKKSEQHLRNLFLTDVFLKMVVTDKPKHSVQHMADN